MPDRPVAHVGNRLLGELLLRRLQLLQADRVRLGLLQPAQQHRQAAVDAVDVVGGDLHPALHHAGTRTQPSISRRAERLIITFFTDHWPASSRASAPTLSIPEGRPKRTRPSAPTGASRLTTVPGIAAAAADATAPPPGSREGWPKRTRPPAPTGASRLPPVPGIAAPAAIATAPVPVIAWCSTPIEKMRASMSITSGFTALPSDAV